MRGILLIFIMCSISTNLCAQGVKTIQLKPERLAYAPVSYHIASVVDDRADKTSLATLKSGGKTEKMNLQGGAAVALSSFISANVTMDKTKQAITVHISKLSFTIKKDGDDWKTDAEATLSFYAGDTKLIDYTAKGQKQSDEDPANYVDEFLKKALEGDLRTFDTWWQKNGKKVPTSATVKVIAKLGSRADKPNTIIYSQSRPLKIADFEAEPEMNILELAATQSGIGIETVGQTENGQVVLTVLVTPYFSRAGSWFKPQGKNPRVLAHEQTHFDITAIKACELIRKIQSSTFSKDNYESELRAMLNQNTVATNAEEAKFDDETNHGTIKEQELVWEEKIKARLKEVGCY